MPILYVYPDRDAMRLRFALQDRAFPASAREEADHRRSHYRLELPMLQETYHRSPATTFTAAASSTSPPSGCATRNGREYDLDFVRHPGAAAVVAVDDAGRVCLVRQYRHGIADFLWEIPAGKLDRRRGAGGLRGARTGRGNRRDRTPLDVPGPVPAGSRHLHRGDPPLPGARSRGRDGRAGRRRGTGDAVAAVRRRPSDSVLRGEWNDGKTALALWRAQYQLQL